MSNVGYALELSKVSRNNELINMAQQLQSETQKRNMNDAFSIIDRAIKMSNTLRDKPAFDFFVEVNKYMNLQIPFLNAEISFSRGENEKSFEFISKGIRESKQRSEFYYSLALLRAYELVNEYAASQISIYSKLMINDFNLDLDIVIFEYDEVMKRTTADVEVENYYKRDFPNRNLFEDVENIIYSYCEIEKEILKNVRLDLMGSRKYFSICMDTPIGRKTLYKYYLENLEEKKVKLNF
jgi:hypothetical protein